MSTPHDPEALKRLLELLSSRDPEKLPPELLRTPLEQILEMSRNRDSSESTTNETGPPHPDQGPPHPDQGPPSPVERALRSSAGKAPTLFLGPPGVGKTFQCQHYAEAHKYERFIFIGGHRGLESFDLLGHYSFNGREMVWVDGEVSEAFRFVGTSELSEVEEVARAGRRVFLMFDEFYRIAMREREFLLSMLSPRPIRGVMCYQLTTGRPLPSGLGDGTLHLRKEVLYAPVKSLTIVATSNLGSEHDIEEDSSAGRERWVRHYIDCTDETFRQIVEQKVRLRGFSASQTESIMCFKTTLDKAKEDRHLRQSLSLRTITLILEIAENEEDLGAAAFQVGQIWLATDSEGRPLLEQVEVLRTAVVQAGWILDQNDDRC